MKKSKEIIADLIRKYEKRQEENDEGASPKILKALIQALNDLDQFAVEDESHTTATLYDFMRDLYYNKMCLGVGYLYPKDNPLEIYKRHYFSFGHYFDNRIELMLFLNRVQHEKRASLLSSCRPLFELVQCGQGYLLSTMACIPPQERDIAIKMAKEIILATPHDNELRQDGFWYADILKAIDTCHQFVQGDKGLLDHYLSFLNEMDYEDLLGGSLSINSFDENNIPQATLEKVNMRLYVMRILNHLPLPQFHHSLEALETLKEQDPIRYKSLYQSPLALPTALINYLKSEGGMDIHLLSDYWQEILQSNPNKPRVKGFADLITTSYQAFGMLEGDDVVQEAIRTGILLDNSTDPLNPYRFFERLSEKRIVPIDWSALKPTTEVLGGLHVSFNPAFFRDELAQFGLTSAQLPPYSETFLDDCVAELDARVVQDHSLMFEISKITSSSYGDLKEHSLSDGTLKRLLTRGGTPSEHVVILKARFIAMISYLETLRSTRTDGEVFSPREESFLRMLESIQGCPNGKSEGINTYYLNVLPVEHRYSVQVNPEENSKNGVAYLNSKAEIAAILLEEVDKMFTGQNQLMKSLVGLRPKDEVSQASHQSGYLRNLIGHFVGLPNQQQFDSHTQLLYVKLVNMSNQEALQAFYTYFVPHGFISRVCSTYDMEEEDVIRLLGQMGMIFSDSKA